MGHAKFLSKKSDRNVSSKIHGKENSLIEKEKEIPAVCYTRWGSKGIAEILSLP
jgi:hypothetical protein